MPGTTLQRDITLTADEKSTISLTVKGPDFVVLSSYSLIIEPNKPQVITIKAIIPSNQPYGTYDGIIIMKTKKYKA